MVAQDRTPYTSFSDLGGRKVGLDELCAEIARLPVDLVLGVLARISGSCLFADFADPRWQGQLLNRAIVDDFPRQLPGAQQMYVPGCIPITQGRHTFIHEHNLCALASLSLAHGRTDLVTRELDNGPITRVCRLLLIINDHLLLDSKRSEAASLKTRRRLAADTLYRGQFNLFTNDLRVVLTALARLKIVLTEHAPAGFDAAKLFHEATGVELSTYFDIATTMMVHARFAAERVTRKQSPWTSAETLWGNVKEGTDAFRAVIMDMVQTPSSFRTEDSPDYRLDFAALQRRPLIEARPGELIAPVASLVQRHLLSYPVIVLSADRDFRSYLGEAYESYAHTLLQRIAASDATSWTDRRSVKVPPGEIDSLVISDRVALAVEHKSGQLTSTLGNFRVVFSAVGPSDDELSKLSALGHPKDSSALTKPIWQLSRLAPAFDEHAKRVFGHTVEKVFPIAVLMENYRVDEWVRRGYLEALMAAAAITWPESWQPMEWLTIRDLEALAQLGDEGKLNIEHLFAEKVAQPWERFDIFVDQQLGRYPPDQMLMNEVEQQLDRATRLLSPA